MVNFTWYVLIWYRDCIFNLCFFYLIILWNKITLKKSNDHLKQTFFKES